MEYTALYREWRSSTFDEVVGQDHIIRILKNQIITDRISHAYLFCGPRGTGKTSTARIFAKAINCMDSKDGNPCGNCHVCNIIESENNMDIIEIDAASNTGVDYIREIRDKVKYPPSAGKYRVYIIDEVHMLSTSAFNAFLKTLEEPPDHVVFILVTTEPHKLLATILSRCQRYDFRRIPLNAIVGRLRTIASRMGVEIEESALETIGRWSEGGMRDSISLLDQCISFSGSSIGEDDVLTVLGTAGKEFLFDVVNNIMEGDISSLLFQIDNLVEEGRDIPVFLKDLINHLRNLLIVDICDDPSGLLDVSQSTLEQYKKQVSKVEQSRLIRSVEILSELDGDIKWNTNPRIMLEMAMVKICRPQDGKALEDLMDRIAVLEKQVSQGTIPINQSVRHHVDQESIDSRPKKATEEDASKKPKVSNPEDAEKKGMEKSGKGDTKKGTDIKETKLINDDQKEKISDNEKTQTQNPTNPASEKPIGKIDIDKAWADVLKKIRKDRMAIFTLLRETKLQFGGKNRNTVNLIFPSHQGFYMAAIEKEENSKYIEDMLAEALGQSFRLKCYTEDNAPKSVADGDIPETPQEQEGKQDNSGLEGTGDDIIQKAIDIFGEEYVEVIDG